MTHLGLVLAAATAAPHEARGTVRGEDARPLAAEVALVCGGRAAHTRAGSDGAFRVALTCGQAPRLRVSAPEHAPRELVLDEGGAPLEVTLARSRFAEQVTVTAARAPTRLGETPASVVIVGAEDLGAAGALAVDDALRQVPGFSLFRRSGSRTANPTSQGVSLRGVGPSGASRAVVLDDGLPLNDPFGGWVYWTRVPRLAVERVEVVRGGASELYGSAALGGTVQLVRSEPRGLGLRGELSYGSQGTAEGSLLAAAPLGPLLLQASAQALRTDGYVPVAPERRGAVDSAADVEAWAGELGLEHRRQDARVFLRGGWFEESRHNGTHLQTNATTVRHLALGADAPFAGGRARLRAQAGTQELDQTFTSISADRSREVLTRDQHTPADAHGLWAQWTRPQGRHLLALGGELRGVSGRVEDHGLTRTPASVGLGGAQRGFAVHAEDTATLGRWRLVGGLRLDRWRNREESQSSAGATRGEARSETALSPRLALLGRLTPRLAATASGYAAFRAPTLNELYRPFRVGNVLTLANPELRAERLRGVEAGLRLRPRPALDLRLQGFWMELREAVANLTLSRAPDLVSRRRQNLGRSRTRGVEVDLEWRLPLRLRAGAGYLLSDSTVTRFEVDPSLVGLRLPQVSRHQGSLQLRHAGTRLTAGVQARFSGAAFEDDQNTAELPAFWLLEARLGYRLRRGLELFAAGENLLDAEYETGRTPVPALGAPRTVRVGLHWAAR